MTSHADEPLPPFPDEAHWLTANLPPNADLPTPDFADRVLRTIVEERALDRDLDRLDRDLPRIVLKAYEAPAPGADFVASTLAKAAADRRARWQHLLARHVAPVPSPEFVQRTLQALAHDRTEVRPTALARRVWTRNRTLLWPLLAAAAGLALWWSSDDRTPPSPFAPRGTTAVAFANQSGALLTALADQNDALALPHLPPDGLQLAFAEVR